jgi:hypothetical protein
MNTNTQNQPQPRINTGLRSRNGIFTAFEMATDETTKTTRIVLEVKAHPTLARMIASCLADVLNDFRAG